MDAGKRMGNILLVVGFDAEFSYLRLIAFFHSLAHLAEYSTLRFQISQRSRQGTIDAIQQIDADVHLQETIAVVIHTLLQSSRHVFGSIFAGNVGIAVDTDFVTELAAQHLPDRDIVDTAYKVP